MRNGRALLQSVLAEFGRASRYYGKNTTVTANPILMEDIWVQLCDNSNLVWVLSTCGEGQKSGVKLYGADTYYVLRRETDLAS